MIYAYFIGGSLDLSKRALPERNPMRQHFAWKPQPVVAAYGSEAEMAGSVVECKREVYYLLGPCREMRDTYVYEYAGDR